MFRKKTKTYHAAAGEIRRYREQTARLNAHRVTLVSDTSYVVTDLAEHFASGRAEDPMLFHKNVAQSATFL